jgi:hypothetical protein
MRLPDVSRNWHNLAELGRSVLRPYKLISENCDVCDDSGLLEVIVGVHGRDFFVLLE